MDGGMDGWMDGWTHSKKKRKKPNNQIPDSDASLRVDVLVVRD